MNANHVYKRRAEFERTASQRDRGELFSNVMTWEYDSSRGGQLWPWPRPSRFPIIWFNETARRELGARLGWYQSGRYLLSRS